jgi:hypothetical protein
MNYVVVMVACTTLIVVLKMLSRVRLETSAWEHTPNDSKRWVRSFAFMPVYTYDAGHIWGKSYYRLQISSGWGFWDDFPYSKRG